MKSLLVKHGNYPKKITILMFARFVHPGPAQIQTGENEEVREEAGEMRERSHSLTAAPVSG